MGIIDLLFPTYCVFCHRWGEYLCSRCFTYLSFDVSLLCCVCNRPSLDGRTHPRCRGRYTLDGAFCGLSYRHGIDKLLYQFKYDPYLSDMKTFLARLMYESLIQKEVIGELLSRKDGILIPIPLHYKKQRTRGYNQSALLAQELGKIVGMPVIDGLVRPKETKPQFGLSAEERKMNMTQAFVVVHNSFDHSVPVFLIDDVLTTGTTLSEAARVLKHAGVKTVYGLCLAREQNE